MGVTLWIVPSAKDALKLRIVMDARPAEHLTSSESSYPKFDPHITLAALPSSVDIADIRSAIPMAQKLLKINFQAVEVGSHFFRSVYVKIEPSSALSELHKHVHAVLGVEPRTPLYPHLSLCYIDDKDAANGARDKFLEELDSQSRIRRDEHDGILLNCGVGNADEDWLGGFDAPEIWIANCEGPVASWSILERIPLH